MASKKEMRTEAESMLKQANRSLEVREKDLALTKELRKVVYDNYKLTDKAIKDAPMEFRKNPDFIRINKEKQDMMYAEEIIKLEQNIADVKVVISEQKKTIKENRG